MLYIAYIMRCIVFFSLFILSDKLIDFFNDFIFFIEVFEVWVIVTAVVIFFDHGLVIVIYINFAVFRRFVFRWLFIYAAGR